MPNSRAMCADAALFIAITTVPGFDAPVALSEHALIIRFHRAGAAGSRPPVDSRVRRAGAQALTGIRDCLPRGREAHRARPIEVATGSPGPGFRIEGRAGDQRNVCSNRKFGCSPNSGAPFDQGGEERLRRVADRRDRSQPGDRDAIHARYAASS